MIAGFVPTCTIIAGPNGAGKSTIVQDLAPAGEFVNADDYARRISPDDVARAATTAARQVLARLGELIDYRQSFTYETTLSSNHSLELMARARQAGFKIDLVFVVLRSRDLHVARVRSRVASGGHDIPTDTILRRYDRSLAHLAPAVSLADEVIVYDNTAGRPVAVCAISGRSVVQSELAEADEFHGRLSRLIADGLHLPTDAVLQRR